MKYILSFFIAAATLCHFVGTELCAAENRLINIRAALPVFSPAKSSFTLKYTPLQNLSLYAGNISFGGLWGSFSSSAPVSPQPLKKAERSSDVFYTSYADKGLFPLYAAADASFADIKTSIFIGVEKSAAAEKVIPCAPERHFCFLSLSAFVQKIFRAIFNAHGLPHGKEALSITNSRKAGFCSGRRLRPFMPTH